MTVPSLKTKSQSTKAENSVLVLENENFDAIFNTYWTRVYGVVYRIVGDHDDSEDIALETFLRLHHRPPLLKTNLSGWLFRVATNLAFNALRSSKRRKSYEEKVGFITPENKAPKNPIEKIERKDEIRRVRLALSKMKIRSARILILRYSGFSYEEISTIVGIKASSVGTLLRRAESEFEKHFKPVNP